MGFGFFGPPWIKLNPRDSRRPNQFGGRIDSRLVPNGPQTLTVVTNDRRARAAIPVTVKNGLKPFLADLHSHTSYSDGTLFPAAAHQERPRG